VGARRGAAAPPVEPKPKPLNLAQTLEEARSAMIKGDYLAAIAGFESILAVDPNYPVAGDLLGVARGGAKNASQLAVDTGNKAEMGGDYAGAQKQYERALQLDPQSTAAPDAMRRLKARMQSEGEDAFKRARQYDAIGRLPDAISMYEKAILLLPPDHASAKTARERLAALKGGV
jgi:tetratricopeptide (TPR) repeat protein